MTTPGFDQPEPGSAPQALTPPPVGASQVVPPQPAPPFAAGAVAPPPVPVEFVEPAVQLDSVNKSFEEVAAVTDLSLTVPTGAVLGIIGPSGAGKTTAIRIISGALKPDSGSVKVLGEDPREFRRRTRESIGYMPQLFVLYPDLTAKENVNFMAALFGIPPWRRAERIREVLELVDLWDARDRRASKLSGGMQRRLELACSLVHEPRLLILDEPTAGIDPLLRTRIWQEIERLRASGVTLLVTTQYVSEAEYCDAVALISEGQLIAHATPTDLRRMALGGEVLEVVTHEPIDASRVPPIDGVTSVRQTGIRQLLFVCNDVGRASPLVIDAVERAGAKVEYSREYRPTFDEIFAALVTSHSERMAAAAAAGAAPPPVAPAEVVQQEVR